MSKSFEGVLSEVYFRKTETFFEDLRTRHHDAAYLSTYEGWLGAEIAEDVDGEDEGLESIGRWPQIGGLAKGSDIRSLSHLVLNSSSFHFNFCW